MLRELLIKDFAIIDRLEVSFPPGLSCLTGETGAGKSILVDAISVVLGGKALPEYVRTGSEASVEAAFDISGLPGLKERLGALGLINGDELIMRRTFSASARGRSYINGSLANIAAMQEVGEFLVDIHGQHEHQSLLKVERHLELLDSYLRLADKAAQCRAAFDESAGLTKRLDALKSGQRERAQRLDMLLFQKREIDDAAPTPGEEAELLNERAKLLHADKLKSLAMSALDGLADAESSALSLLRAAQKAAREIAAISSDQAETARLIESAEVSAGEACACLRAFSESLDADPARLSDIEGRLDTLSRLKKKYGETIEDVLEYRARLDDELSSIEGGEEELSDLETRAKEAGAKLLALADTLTPLRVSGAEDFCRRVEAELAGLGMDKARFEVRFETLPAPGPRGLEKAEFLISANPGEPPKALSKVASGGELSRVMLALKVILAGSDGVPTLIFDEVDSGVGGATAGAVGRKLKEAALGRQVLCVTHLPQIASLAGEHYLVEKRVEKGRTKVNVVRLDKHRRIIEVARMLGGEGSKSASAHAEELIKQGEARG